MLRSACEVAPLGHFTCTPVYYCSCAWNASACYGYACFVDKAFTVVKNSDDEFAGSCSDKMILHLEQDIVQLHFSL